MPTPLPATQERVDRLEESINRFVASVGVEFNSVLNYAERLGFPVLAAGDAVMEIKNRPGFEAIRW